MEDQMKSSLPAVSRRRARARRRGVLDRRPHRDAPGRRRTSSWPCCATPTRRGGRQRRRGLARHGARVPVLGNAAETDARDVRATAGYWRRDYAALAPQHDANGVITETDPAILLLAANAAFRASQGDGDRTRHAPPARHRRQELRGSAEEQRRRGDRACDSARSTPRSTTSTRSARATRWRSSAAGRREGRAESRGEGRRRRSAGRADAARQAGRAAGGGRHEPVQDRDPETRRRAQGCAATPARADRRSERDENSGPRT